MEELLKNVAVFYEINGFFVLLNNFKNVDTHFRKSGDELVLKCKSYSYSSSYLFIPHKKGVWTYYTGRQTKFNRGTKTANIIFLCKIAR